MLFSNVCSNANLQKYTGVSGGGASVRDTYVGAGSLKNRCVWGGTFVDGHQPVVLTPVADSF